MSEQTDKIDLSRLSLEPGGGRRLEVEVAAEPIRIGGQSYEPWIRGGKAQLDVSRTTSGWALHLTAAATLHGACVRCLEPADFTVEIDAREVDELDAEDEELRSPYVEDGFELDASAWLHDALVLAMPLQPLCREDCAGLCAVCGASLNDADPEEHRHGEQRDPRWAKLDELKLD